MSTQTSSLRSTFNQNTKHPLEVLKLQYLLPHYNIAYPYYTAILENILELIDAITRFEWCIQITNPPSHYYHIICPVLNIIDAITYATEEALLNKRKLNQYHT